MNQYFLLTLYMYINMFRYKSTIEIIYIKMEEPIEKTPSRVYTNCDDLSQYAMFHIAFLFLDWIQILLTKITQKGDTDAGFWWFY